MFGKKKRNKETASTGNPAAPGFLATGNAASGEPPPIVAESRIGRYTILEPLGQGGMGTVYGAQDPVIGRRVAIKVISIRPDLAEEEARQYRERFLREAQAAGALIHPHIVAVHDIGQDPATLQPYIVMEHVEGQDLKKVIRSKAPLPPREAVRIVMQIASALDYAHSRGIVHRDIKPANILLSEQGEVKITDFGVARLPGSDLTRSDQFVGSPGFMSPEQLKGGTVDGRSDLFALGVILYQLLTGRSPFDGESVSEVLYKISTQPAEPPSEVYSDVSSDFDPILEKALAKDPAGRYQTGQEMIAALLPLSGQEVEAPERGPSQGLASEAAGGVLSASVTPRPSAAARRSGASPWWTLSSQWRLGFLVAFLALTLVGVNWAIHALMRGPLGRLAGVESAPAPEIGTPVRGGAPRSLGAIGAAFPAGGSLPSGSRGGRKSAMRAPAVRTGAAPPHDLHASAAPKSAAPPLAPAAAGGPAKSICAMSYASPKQMAQILAASRHTRTTASGLADRLAGGVRVDLRHQLSSGRLIVLLDGRTVLSKPFDAPRGKKTGTVSHLLSLPAGKHGLEVRVLGDHGESEGKSKIAAVVLRDQVVVLKAEQRVKSKTHKELKLEWAASEQKAQRTVSR
ncbi:MAG TPA: protein kinase [Candidatus Polarisedimenticolia bacterium]|nr:protein kinase [Candidatus Polarisedimenticolia bacterium]